MGKRRGRREVKPATRVFRKERVRATGATTQAAAAVACPKCGAELGAVAEEIGESRLCPACGAPIEAVPDAAVPPVTETPEAPEPEEAAEAEPAVAMPEEPSPARPPDAAVAEVQEPGAEPSARRRRHADFLVWQGVVQLAGDWAMAARLQALRYAEQAGCKMTVSMPDGSELNIPEMVMTEAAVAAFESQTEAEWREQWTRRLLSIAATWPDKKTTQTVVAVLTHTSDVIAELKAAGVWPWSPARAAPA